MREWAWVTGSECLQYIGSTVYAHPPLPTATETSAVMMKAVARLAPERGAEEGLAAETEVEGRAEPKMEGPVTVCRKGGPGLHQA